MLMNNVSREEAKNMARQLVDYCKSLNESVGNVTPALGLSVGISLIGAHKKMEIGEIITQADEALYKAKKSGKGTFIVIEN
jgi:diguanylate cyclase (GGDEF)-like protein